MKWKVTFYAWNPCVHIPATRSEPIRKYVNANTVHPCTVSYPCSRVRLSAWVEDFSRMTLFQSLRFFLNVHTTFLNSFFVSVSVMQVWIQSSALWLCVQKTSDRLFQAFSRPSPSSSSTDTSSSSRNSPQNNIQNTLPSEIPSLMVTRSLIRVLTRPSVMKLISAVFWLCHVAQHFHYHCEQTYWTRHFTHHIWLGHSKKRNTSNLLMFTFLSRRISLHLLK